MENKFDSFLRCLGEAGRRIDSHYIRLDVAGCSKQIYRERVYCYELYHQLRCVLGDSSPYELNGEVDKAGHPIIQKALGAKKPDFIVHVQGEMSRNLVVIEVKPITVKENLDDLRKDLETLKGFLDEAHYSMAIMLIYGGGDCDLPQEIRSELEDSRDERILLVWHRGPGERPALVDI
jgi:hypothetical protein